jgi:hypothetical protein
MGLNFATRRHRELRIFSNAVKRARARGPAPFCSKQKSGSSPKDFSAAPGARAGYVCLRFFSSKWPLKKEQSTRVPSFRRARQKMAARQKINKQCPETGAHSRRGRCSRARAPFQARHCLFAFPSSQQGRSFYQLARNHRVSGVCRPEQSDPGAP